MSLELNPLSAAEPIPPPGGPSWFRRLSWPGRIGFVGLAILVLVGLIAPYVFGDEAARLSQSRRESSSWAHLLGTDALGRDMLARTLVATRVTLIMALVAMVLGAGIGSLVGTAVAFAAPRWRKLGERVIDLTLTFPPLILAIAVVAIFSPSATSASVAIGCAVAPAFARLTNTLAGSVAGREFVDVARLIGVPSRRIVARHVFPNISAPLLVLVSVVFVQSIIGLSALSFLGLGVQAPTYDWGSMLSEGFLELYVNPVQALGPAAAIVLTGILAGFAGDGIARLGNPVEPVRATPRPAPAVSSVTDPDDAFAGLRVRDLQVVRADGVPLVKGISFDVQPGEIVGIIGESGSGKSLTAMALAGLLPPGLQASATVARLGPQALMADADGADLASLLGIVFQDPSSSFNPAMRIGAQLTEAVRVHTGMSRTDAGEKAVSILREVHVSQPEKRMRQYPHELSGGMRQRAMLAMALMNDPALLIADEPTTALDVTVQDEVLRLVREASTRRGAATIFISHDLGVITEICDTVLVMYAGRIVERVSVDQLRAAWVAHPYTRALVDATPRLLLEQQDTLVSIPGRPPLAGDPATGCQFAPRCDFAVAACRTTVPVLRPLGREGHSAACHALTEEGVLHAL